MPTIEFLDVGLKLGGRTILSGISLEIGAGEFLAVLGPNGAGKTTLMRAILGLIAPDRGSINVLGRPASRGNADVGYVPQVRTFAASSHLSGRDFVASVFNGHRLGLPLLGKTGRIEIERTLDLVGARELAARPLAETSGGERQRLLLAQALVGRPRLLLLDEPLISLDLRHQREVVTLVKSVQAELGVTVLFSSHELNPLLGAIDRVLYLGCGLAALGTVDEVITGTVLSRLYGSEIEVVRIKDRIFVVGGQHAPLDGHECEEQVERAL
jgi:zinc/manganese transport system ATP-binding protein